MGSSCSWSLLRLLPGLLLLLVLLHGCSSRGAPGQAPGPGAPTAGALTVSFLDVGQGDATLITSPTGKQVLIDGGPPEAGEALLTALRRRRVEDLDLVLLTHPHLDHLGGLTKVVRALPVRNYLDSGFSHPSPAYTALLRALADRGVAVRQAAAGRRIDLGDGATLTLLGPPQPYLARTRSDVNANSAVSRLTWRSVAALLTGDAEPETEAALLQGEAPLAAGLLKVAHHGGRFSSTMPFLRAVGPALAVISVGARNDYGHPTEQALSRLAAVGARVYRTDLFGDVTVRCGDGTSWSVVTERPQGPAEPPAGTVTGEDRRPRRAGEQAPARETGAPASEAGTQAERGAAQVLGSRRSDVFHRPDCPALGKIRPENLERFSTREEALAQGRRPAADCHP